MKVYHVQFDCGDYYCDSMHTIGIFDSREKAQAGVEQYKRETLNVFSQRFIDGWGINIAEREINEVLGYGE